MVRLLLILREILIPRETLVHRVQVVVSSTSSDPPLCGSRREIELGPHAHP